MSAWLCGRLSYECINGLEGGFDGDAAVVHGLVDGERQGKTLDRVGIGGEDFVGVDFAADGVDERLVAVETIIVGRRSCEDLVGLFDAVVAAEADGHFALAGIDVDVARAIAEATCVERADDAVGERHDRGRGVFDVVVGNVRDDAFTASGLYLDDVAEEITAEIVVVDCLLDDLTTGLFLSAPPPDHRETAEAVGGQHGDFVAADFRSDVALDEIEGVGVAALEADGRDELLLLDARENLLGILEVERHRFLAEERDAFVDGDEFHAVMGARLDADVDGVQFFLFEHLLIIGIDVLFIESEAFRAGFGAFGDQIAGGDDLGLVLHFVVVAEMELGDTAATDETESDFLHEGSFFVWLLD